jgi:hypothetical protein
MSNRNNKNWFSRDADAIRADLLRYARNNFGDKISDFSPASLGGMLLELSAQVGDNFQFYLDYLFSESQWDTATEERNITRFLRDVGIVPFGNLPSSTVQKFQISVPAFKTPLGPVPLNDALPVIEAGTTLIGPRGIRFTLVEDIDFSERDVNNLLTAAVVNTLLDDDGVVTEFTLEKSGIVVSGSEVVEDFQIPQNVNSFYSISLSNPNIFEIVSVTDGDGNRWYEVENFAQETIYKRVRNLGEDREWVPFVIKTINTNRKFIREYSINTGITRVVFGGGNEDFQPDFEDISGRYNNAQILPSRLDPNNIINSTGFGELPNNRSIKVVYRHGGGEITNVSNGSISVIDNLLIRYPRNLSPQQANVISNNLLTFNEEVATGGANALTIEQYRDLIPLRRVAQGRIVSSSDLLARITSLPSQFGKIYKAASRPGLPGQPTKVWVVCRRNNQLINASSALKENLKNYIANERLIGDAVEILDCPIMNWGIRIKVIGDNNWNKQTIISELLRNLSRYVNRLNMSPDEALDIDRMRNLITATDGVFSISSIEIVPKSFTDNSNQYSEYFWSTNQVSGKIIPPPGGIFEMKFINDDIEISVI